MDLRRAGMHMTVVFEQMQIEKTYLRSDWDLVPVHTPHTTYLNLNFICYQGSKQPATGFVIICVMHL